MQKANAIDITDDQIERLFEMVRLAAGAIVGRGEQHMPMLMPLGAHGRVLAHFVIFGANLFPRVARRWLKRPDVIGYLFINESWLASLSPGAVVTPPRLAPGRIEVIRADIWTREGDGFCRLWRIDRESPPPHLVEYQSFSTRTGWAPSEPTINFYGQLGRTAP